MGYRFAIVLVLGIWVACERPTAPSPVAMTVEPAASGLVALADADTLFTLAALKWRDGARAAISINYDAPWGTHPDHHLATDAVIARGLRMDIELVSWIFQQPKRQGLIDVYKQDLIPKGIHFFGHGHTHALHDTMSYNAAYRSFKTNFDLMTAWGLNPKVYAYPGSSGKLATTQAANAAAGFISARGDSPSWQEALMLAGPETEPDNWYFLPSVVMGNASYRYLDTHEKLVPVLDRTLKDGAWVILMYHAIGISEGWSYYPIDDFRRDLDAIAAGDFWSANMDVVTCYVQERNALRLDVVRLGTGGATDTVVVRIDDDLPDDMYEEPLTFELTAKIGAVALTGEGSVVADPGQTVRFEALPRGAVFTFHVVRNN